MKKECISCKEVLDIAYFSYRTDTKKHRNQCKKCHKGYNTDLEDRRNETKSLFKSGLKRCSRCDQIKEISEFHRDKITSTGFASRCKICIHELQSQKCRTEVAISRAKSLYNLTREEALDVLSKKKCDICKRKFNSKNILCIDHCHETNDIRGALCRNCNIGIGLMKDNVDILYSAIKYLENAKRR